MNKYNGEESRVEWLEIHGATKFREKTEEFDVSRGFWQFVASAACATTKLQAQRVIMNFRVSWTVASKQMPLG